MNCLIGLNMIASILSNCKTIFHERHESQVERDNFKNILNSFSQGVIIVKRQVGGETEPKSPHPLQVLFMNNEIVRVLGFSEAELLSKPLFQ